MPRPPSPIDMNDLVQRYLAGETVQELARQLRAEKARIRRILLAQGVLRTKAEAVGLGGKKRRSVLDTETVLPAYLAGESVESIAARLDAHERTVRRTLIENGVTPRNRSESNGLRMSRTPLEERRALTAAARVALVESGVLYSPEVQERRSATRQRGLTHIGIGEAALYEFLCTEGLQPVRQLAVSPYNLDIAIHPIAVEVHNTLTTAPLSGRPQVVKRTKALIQRGWGVLYVWISRHDPVTPAAAKYAVSYLQEAQRDPTTLREYRVIRGSGELVSRSRLDGDQFTFVPASETQLHPVS